jgi:hypothetical protein
MAACHVSASSSGMVAHTGPAYAGPAGWGPGLGHAITSVEQQARELDM